MGNKFNIKNWSVKDLGKRQFELVYTPSEGVHYMTLTGSAVTVDLQIPHAFRLQRVEVKHTDSAKANGTDAFTWFFQVLDWSDGLPFKIISYTASVVSDFLEDDFLEVYSYPQGSNFQFSLDSTNTDLAYLKVIIQLLEAVP